MKIIRNKEILLTANQGNVWKYKVFWFHHLEYVNGLKMTVFAKKKDAIEFCKKMRKSEKLSLGHKLSFIVKEKTTRAFFRDDVEVEYIKWGIK